MIRGTTPVLLFTVPFDPTVTKEIWITFSQHNKEVFTIEKGQCTFEDKTIKVKLTQKQTLALNANTNVKIQIRVSFADGNTDSALASDIITVPVQHILKDGEI